MERGTFGGGDKTSRLGGEIHWINLAVPYPANMAGKLFREKKEDGQCYVLFPVPLHAKACPLSLSLVSIRVLKFRKVKFTTCSTTCSELARGLAGVRILLNIPPTPLGRVTFTEVALKRDR